MPIVVYKCDTCKREIELQRLIKGLETVGRCSITHGCRGSLYQTNLYPDYIRGSLPDPVVGLDDWKQRKVLHNHQQAIERSEWIIEHGMGVIPAVSVFVSRPIEGNPDNEIEITPDDVIPVGDDILKLVFDRAWSGKAQLIARQSDPNLLRPTTRIIQETESAVQISNLGEITIATRTNPALNAPEADLSAPIISLLFSYDSTTGAIVPELYNADDQPSLNSPWRGSNFSRIVVNAKHGRQPYLVRSFNGIVPNITTGAVGSGSTFKFTQVDPTGSGNSLRDILPGEVLILLASSPYDTVDKLLDKYIDITDVTDDNNPFGFFYNNGEFFAIPEIVKSVFPAILNIDN